MRLRYRKILYFNTEPLAAPYKALYGMRVWYHKKKLLPDGIVAQDEYGHPIYWVYTVGGKEVEISERFLSLVQATYA